MGARIALLPCCLLTTVFLLVGVRAQVIGFGSCPSVSVVSNFNVSQYTGVWYENRRYFALFELNARCVTATYTLNSDGASVAVLNQAKQGIFGRSTSVSGTARQLSPPSGKLGVSFPSVPFSPTDAPYWVLGTDYTTYSVVWSCSNIAGLFNSQFSWILTRQQNPDSSVVNTALGVIDQNGLSRSPFIQTTHSNC